MTFVRAPAGSPHIILLAKPVPASNRTQILTSEAIRPLLRKPSRRPTPAEAVVPAASVPTPPPSTSAPTPPPVAAPTPIPPTPVEIAPAPVAAPLLAPPAPAVELDAPPSTWTLERKLLAANALLGVVVLLEFLVF